MLRFFPAFCFLALTPSALLHAANITLSVDAEPQQEWRAFGYTVGYADTLNPWLQGKVPDSLREEYADVLYDDLNTNTLRFWWKYDTEAFVKKYVETGIMEEARERGVEYFALGPHGWFPPQFTEGGYLRDIQEYADFVADFIIEMRDEYGVEFQATGLINEPGSASRDDIRPEDYTRTVKIFRDTLDRKGLSHVTLIMMEHWGSHTSTLEFAKAVAADPEASQKLDALGSHSYGFGVYRETAEIVLQEGWEYWQTEAGGARSPADIAARLLNDVNNAVTHWHFFLGPGQSTGRHYLAAPGGDSVRTAGHYWSLQVIAKAFLPGTIIRHTTSSRDGNMIYKRTGFPSLIATAGVRADGKWVMGAAAISGGHTLTWDVPGLAAGIPFEVCRSGGSPMNCDDTVTSSAGSVEVSIGNGQTISLVAGEPTEQVRPQQQDDQQTVQPQPQPQPEPRPRTGPCHLLTRENAGQLPAGFAAPWNVFSGVGELLIKVTCLTDGVQLEIGTGNNLQYVYGSIFYWSGTGWQQAALTSTSPAGDGTWHIGRAQARLPAPQPGTNFVVGYVCTWRLGNWQCGCRDEACAESLWQLQVYRQVVE